MFVEKIKQTYSGSYCDEYINIYFKGFIESKKYKNNWQCFGTFENY